MQRTRTVILDLTERCNLKCVMCYFSAVDRLRFAPYDREISPQGILPVEVFEKIAADLFPSAWRVALGCAAEPMLHPRFREILEITGRYDVPDVWFPTNLLALTEANAEALVDTGVAVVAASVDGFTRETYEKIRVGGTFARLEQRLDLLNEVKARRGSKTPNLRFIFTWMRSNREELRLLPAFAEKHGAAEIDVRFVAETTGVDVGPELLDDEDPEILRRELREVAEEAVGRGLRLASYPEFEIAEERPAGIVGRLRRRAWRWKAGLERMEYWRHYLREKRLGCGYPGETWVVRPNGAVYPCVFWQEEPIGFYPEDNLESMLTGEVLGKIQDGLRTNCPIGTCATCGQRRDALYRPFRRLGQGSAEILPTAEGPVG